MPQFGNPFVLSVENIHATPRVNRASDERMRVTRGCPCDLCEYKQGCKVECATFNSWVNDRIRKR